MAKGVWGWLRMLTLMVGFMSGILSLVREFLLFAAPNRFQEAPLFWASARIAFILSAVAAWVLENRAKQNLQKEIETTKEKFFSERPRIAFAVESPRNLQEWQSLNSTNRPPLFRLEHCGGRTARWVTIAAIMSESGTFKMEFDQAPVLGAGSRQFFPLTVTIHQNGVEDIPDPRILQIQQGGDMIAQFFRDRPPEQRESFYGIRVLYRDQNGSDEYEERMILKCVYPTLALSVEPSSNNNPGRPFSTVVPQTGIAKPVRHS